MKKVVLRGELGKQFGRVHHFDLNTPAEAIRALCANFEGFQQALVTAAERGVGYIVQVGKAAIEEGNHHGFPGTTERHRVLKKGVSVDFLIAVKLGEIRQIKNQLYQWEGCAGAIGYCSLEIVIINASCSRAFN